MVKKFIREVENFPIPGVSFKDLSLVFGNPQLMKTISINTGMYFNTKNIKFTKVIGIESRGFMLATLISQLYNIPFVMIRKKGKLPFKTFEVEFDYEYASTKLEILQDAIDDNDVILIHDDVLATGNTAYAIAEMITKNFGIKKENICFSFIADLDYIKTDVKTKLLNEYKCYIVEKL